jgi:hypothetical protein
MPRLVNAVTGVVVNVDEETAKGLDREWSSAGEPAPTSEGKEPETPPANADETPSEPEAPAGNASLAEWQAYATSKGKTEEELKDLKREEIKALFESE